METETELKTETKEDRTTEDQSYMWLKTKDKTQKSIIQTLCKYYF